MLCERTEIRQINIAVVLYNTVLSDFYSVDIYVYVGEFFMAK